jgi:hypothetical protein
MLIIKQVGSNKKLNFSAPSQFSDWFGRVCVVFGFVDGSVFVPTNFYWIPWNYIFIQINELGGIKHGFRAEPGTVASKSGSA